MYVNNSLKKIMLKCILLILTLLFSFRFSSAAEKILALTAPYPTVTDGVSMTQVRRFWRGFHYGVPFQTLIMTAETLDELISLWGEPSGKTDIQVMDADDLLQTAWEQDSVWGVIPFEELDPRWKVIAIEGVSPFSLDFDPAGYSRRAAHVGIWPTNLSKKTRLVRRGSRGPPSSFLGVGWGPLP